jgi:hypothetical protein
MQPPFIPERWRPRFSRGHLAAGGVTFIAVGLLVAIELSAAGLIFYVLGVLAFWLPTPRHR